MIPPLADIGNDVMALNATYEGIFIIKSAYFLIESQSANTYSSIYKNI